jgi:hypothetical protein
MRMVRELLRFGLNWEREEEEEEEEEEGIGS